MESDTDFGTARLLRTDARLACAVLNHMRYQAMSSLFGMSREQANLLTVALLLSAADGTYEAARRITGMRVPGPGAGAALAAIAFRDATLGVAGPSTRRIPGAGALLALAVLGGLGVPGLRRTAHRMRAAERRFRDAGQRLRDARIRRYAAAEDAARASAA